MTTITDTCAYCFLPLAWSPTAALWVHEPTGNRRCNPDRPGGTTATPSADIHGVRPGLMVAVCDYTRWMSGG